VAYATSKFNHDGFAARIAGILGSRWRQYRVYRSTYAELNALSRRELDDLGISRHAISRMAAEAARRAA